MAAVPTLYKDKLYYIFSVFVQLYEINDDRKNKTYGNISVLN